MVFKKIFWAFLLVQITSLQFLSAVEEVHFLFSMKNKQLIGHTLLTIPGVDEMFCLFQCGQRADCGSVNYNNIKKICVLNNGNSEANEFSPGSESGVDMETDLIDAEGWKYFKKSEKVKICYQSKPYRQEDPLFHMIFMY